MEKQKETEVKPILLFDSNYYTSYKCDCQSTNVHFDEDGNACFSAIFSRVKGVADYLIKVCVEPSILLRNKNNYCLLPMYDIVQWLDYICSICGGSYKIKDTTIWYRKYVNFSYIKETEYPCYGIELHLDSPLSMMHKFALTAVRYLYEFPRSVILAEVFKLKDLQTFQGETLLNLYNLIAMSYANTRGIYCQGHSFTGDTKLVTDEYLKHQLKTHCTLNEMFTRADCFTQMMTIRDNNMLDYWEDGKIFAEKRLPVYKYNYDLLIKEGKLDYNQKDKK